VPIYHTGEAFLDGVQDKLAQGGPVTIVCLGDSVTAGGDATSPDKTFVGLFRSGLRERYPGAEVRVVNAGIGGTNSDFGLERLDRDVLAHDPDLVVVEFVNDMSFPPAKIRENYRALVDRTRSGGAEVILLTPHFTRWTPMSDQFHDAAQALRQAAFKEEAALGDVTASWSAMSRVGVPFAAYLANGINHPDDRGHRVYAETLLAFFGEK
jgi:lysophospholipase L1-like esterase